MSMLVKGKTKIYKVKMPDGRIIKLWFSGKQFEELLKAYNIPYEYEVKNGQYI